MFSGAAKAMVTFAEGVVVGGVKDEEAAGRVWKVCRRCWHANRAEGPLVKYKTTEKLGSATTFLTSTRYTTGCIHYTVRERMTHSVLVNSTVFTATWPRKGVEQIKSITAWPGQLNGHGWLCGMDPWAQDTVLCRSAGQGREHSVPHLAPRYRHTTVTFFILTHMLTEA